MLSSQIASQKKFILPFLKMHKLDQKKEPRLICKKNNFVFNYIDENGDSIRLVFCSASQPCQGDYIEVYKGNKLQDEETSKFTILWLEYLTNCEQNTPDSQ